MNENLLNSNSDDEEEEVSNLFLFWKVHCSLLLVIITILQRRQVIIPNPEDPLPIFNNKGLTRPKTSIFEVTLFEFDNFKFKLI
jgi:hypothetical protein